MFDPSNLITIYSKSICIFSGWHHRINGRVGKVGAAFYILVPLLLQEAETVELVIQLVSEQSLTRYQRATYRKIHTRLFKLCEEYEDNAPGMTTNKLLREASYTVGFTPVPERHEGSETHVWQWKWAEVKCVCAKRFHWVCVLYNSFIY